MEEEEEDDATETTEMLIDVENLEIEGEEGSRTGRANMSRIEFWARGGLNQSCGEMIKDERYCHLPALFLLQPGLETQQSCVTS